MATCCLVAASDFNQNAFIALYERGALGFIVAVDAGLRHVQVAGCAPDFIVGDFDSLGYEPEGENVEVHPVHKDESDLELALDFALERGFDTVYLFGALGGRLDHTMGNLQTCARFAELGMRITIVGSDCAVHIMVGPETYELPTLDSGTVSVFSAVDCSHGVTERGMEYPLDNAALSNRTSLGLSNELIGKPASVSVERGTLYVFHPLEL